DQFLDLAAEDIDNVGQIGVHRGIGAFRLLGVVVGRGLLGADQRGLGRVVRAGAQVDEFLGTQVAPSPQAGNHHRPFEQQLIALLVAEGQSPAAEFIDPLPRVDQVAKEGVGPQLAVAEDVHAGPELQGNRLFNRLVFDLLELYGAARARFVTLAGFPQVRGAQETANDITPVYMHHSPPVLAHVAAGAALTARARVPIRTKSLMTPDDAPLLHTGFGDV